MLEDDVLIHATAVSLQGCGLLIKGPSGSGKSDLALRLLRVGGELIADDQVILKAEEGHLIASAPHNLRGLCEVRGLGIINLKFKGEHPIDYVIHLKPISEIARYPLNPVFENIKGIQLPVIELNAFEASVIDKVLILVEHNNTKKQVSGMPTKAVIPA